MNPECGGQGPVEDESNDTCQYGGAGCETGELQQRLSGCASTNADIPDHACRQHSTQREIGERWPGEQLSCFAEIRFDDVANHRLVEENSPTVDVMSHPCRDKQNHADDCSAEAMKAKCTQRRAEQRDKDEAQ